MEPGSTTEGGVIADSPFTSNEIAVKFSLVSIR